jgi:DNA-directed RNA polymerase subunit N (RpoN/RPB10)
MLAIRCITCGKPVAQLYQEYKQEVRKIKLAKGKNIDKIEFFSSTNIEKSAEGKVMDDLGLKRICCRRTILTHPN